MAVSFSSVGLLVLVAAVLVNTDMNVDCGPDGLTLVWTESRSLMDFSLLRLGSCQPTTVSSGAAMFSVEFADCNFRRTVTKETLEYSNDLTSASPQNTKTTFSHPVSCKFERAIDWAPPMYDPSLLQTHGVGDLLFTMDIMNANFSGPAQSLDFSLGSLIPIMATVAQHSHQPLLLLLDECVATNAPDLHSEGDVYSIISNHGCLMDSKWARSRFEPREVSSEIRLSLQAFKFAVGKKVYIHCTLEAWDPSALFQNKKACHIVDNRWELLDDPSKSSLCGCCDASCSVRKTRSTSGRGIKHSAVLGPLTIVD